MSACEIKRIRLEKIRIKMEEMRTERRALRFWLKRASASLAIATSERKTSASAVTERRLSIIDRVESKKDCHAPAK